MKSILKTVGFAIICALVLSACDTYPSLQKYFVDSKENDEFISVDFPASIIKLKEVEITEEMQKTIETINKVNFLALPLSDANRELYTSEKEKVKKIFKNPKYKQLMRVHIANGKGNMQINYLGEEEAIDEVILYGYENEKGFAIVRVIGENMNPSDILSITSQIKLDSDSPEMKQLEGLLSSIQ